MAAEDGERGGPRRKPKLLLGRTRTRSTGEETKPEPAGNGEETSAGSDKQTTCRGRQSDAGKRRRRWWSGLSSAVSCIRRQEDGEASPPEGALQRQEDGEASPPEGALQRQEDGEASPPEGALQRQEDGEASPPEGALQRQEDGEASPPEGALQRQKDGEASPPEGALQRQEDGEASPPEGALQRQEDGEASPPEGALQRQEDGEASPPEGALQRQEDGEASPPEGALQRQDGEASPPEGAVQRQDGEASPPEGALQRQEETRKMRNVLWRFVPLRKKSSPWFRTKLQKFFIRAGRRRFVPPGHEEDTVLGTDLCASGLAEIPEGPPQVQMFCYQAEHLPEEPEPTAEMADPEDGPVPVQMAQINQVLVRDVSSEEDEVLFDSELVVDLHDQPKFQFPPEDKTVQMSVPPQPSTNGPSIRIQLCPPDDSAQEEEEEEEGWVGVASAESHLLHLICSDPTERQLQQAARSLVRTAMTAAVDQLTGEQRGSGGSAHLEPPGAR
ncbi:ribosome-binding protein 1-like [Xiphophorus maculatus]|uniref:ribosome-binding protein 1-like n=1 Tax=Xiphophorus maculatus TaxID=8083 RepID=UPI000C6EBD92|nr:ribosome-binding protein 1-like [Xiphophorus maculatus]